MEKRGVWAQKLSPLFQLWALGNPLALVWLPEGPRGISQAQVPWLKPVAAHLLVFARFPEPGPFRSSPLRGSITPAFHHPCRSPAWRVG